MKALKTKSHYAMESGISPILALGTLHGAFGGAGTSWVGGHPGFNAPITDTAAGNYTVNLPINFALALITVHAQSMTAATRCSVILSAGPAVGGIATTDVQVLCYDSAGALGNADVMLVAFSTSQMAEKDSPVVAMGHIHEAALAGTWQGAAPGFNPVITNGGGAGDYTITCLAQSATAQLNLLVTPATADRNVSVVKTNVPNVGTTFRIVSRDNAGAVAESDLYVTVVDTMPPLGKNPIVAGGTLDEALGGPGTWVGVSHHGFAALPITRTAAGVYTVTTGADNTTQIVNVFGTTGAAGADDYCIITKPTATTVRIVSSNTVPGAVEPGTVELTAIII